MAPGQEANDDNLENLFDLLHNNGMLMLSLESPR